MSYNTLTELMTGIADAIRSKLGTSSKILSQDMPQKIMSISGGGGGDTLVPFPNNFTFMETAGQTDKYTCQINMNISKSGYYLICGLSVSSTHRQPTDLLDKPILTIDTLPSDTVIVTSDDSYQTCNSSNVFYLLHKSTTDSLRIVINFTGQNLDYVGNRLSLVYLGDSDTPITNMSLVTGIDYHCSDATSATLTIPQTVTKKFYCGVYYCSANNSYGTTDIGFTDCGTYIDESSKKPREYSDYRRYRLANMGIYNTPGAEGTITLTSTSTDSYNRTVRGLMLLGFE